MKKWFKPSKVILFCLLCFFARLHSQEIKQSIQGRVIDKETQQPLAGAHIVIKDSNPLLYSVSDDNGNFFLKDVPIGRVSLTVSYVGYNSVELNNLVHISGKELKLLVEMEESITRYDEVIVTSSKQKLRPSNEMAMVSSRSFSVEETERYAGSRGDVARMASNYAGVAFANDQRNDIIIRGNSPSGLLWRLDDVEIPNPNHFAENGTTGGPVSMLNNNVLRNSDFYTGAFPAEFGNALSGVFDLKMRNGNTEKHEYTIQSGFNGVEVGAEGPIYRKNNSSFLVYYRYSFLDLMDKIGFSFGTSGVPRYQDIVAKVNYPTQKGAFEAFIMGGKSRIDMLSSRLKDNDIYLSEGEDIYNRAMMGVASISYTHFINEKSYIKFLVSTLYQNGGTDIDTLDKDNKNPFRYIEHNIDEYRASFSSFFNYKHSSKLSSKAGLQVDQMGYSLNSKSYSEDSLRLLSYLNHYKSLYEGPQLLRLFYQMKWKANQRWEYTAGLENLFFTLNNSYSIEPRIAASFYYSKNASLSIGYGLHSHTQPLAVYYLGDYFTSVGYLETNKNLDFTKAHHFVLSNDWSISQNMRLKFEMYYQYLFNVPISEEHTWYSLINSGASWGVDAYDSLVNKGLGKNYGIEFTLERFFSKQYYFLVTTSLYQSFYKAGDNTWHHTVFDGNYIVNCLIGYEHPVNNHLSLAFDSKVSTAGGKRYIPIDFARSVQAGETKYDETQIFEKQYAPFFKVDIKFSLILNKPGNTNEWQIYIENITNHQNPLYEYYNNFKQKITKVYQLGFFPMILWRLTF
jgi:hypothetical protein